MFQYGDYVTLNARNEKGKASTRIGIVLGKSILKDHTVVQWDIVEQPTHIVTEKLIKVG